MRLFQDISMSMGSTTNGSFVNHIYKTSLVLQPVLGIMIRIQH